MKPSESKPSIFWQRWRKLLAMMATHQSILCLLGNKEKNKASCCLDKVSSRPTQIRFAKLFAMLSKHWSDTAAGQPFDSVRSWVIGEYVCL